MFCIMTLGRYETHLLYFIFFPFPVQSECVMAGSNESTVTINFYCTDKRTEEGFLLKMNYSVFFIKGESRFRKKIKQYCIFNERPNMNKNIDTE